MTTIEPLQLYVFAILLVTSPDDRLFSDDSDFNMPSR
jgi:hypothetical protein